MSQILRKTSFLLKKVKRMLYLSRVLLRYVQIYNLEVSFNFHLTFLPLTLIKKLTLIKILTGPRSFLSVYCTPIFTFLAVFIITLGLFSL